MRRIRQAASFGLLVAAVSLSAAPPTPKKIQPGVVVEEVGDGSAAEKAGIKPGDVLLSWERAANLPANPAYARGEFESPFDAREVEIEQAPRGTVTLTTNREGKRLSHELPVGVWTLVVRPSLPARSLNSYLEGRRLIQDKKVADALGIWERMAADWTRTGDRDLAIWLDWRIGQTLDEAKDWNGARAAFDRAITAAATAKRRRIEAQLWGDQGRALVALNQLSRAAEAFNRSLELREAAAPSSLAAADLLNSMGNLAYSQSNSEGASRAHERALALREKLAPGSLAVAESLNNLGRIARVSGHLESAEILYRRSLEIAERLAPGSLDVAIALGNLGVVGNLRGDPLASERLFRQALAIFEAVSPGTEHVAGQLTNLGGNALQRGMFDEGEVLLKRALEIFQRQRPGGPGAANILMNLGILAQWRGDLILAERYFRRALAIQEKLAPQGMATAHTLSNMGQVAAARGDLGGAEGLYRLALAIQEKKAPASTDVARTYRWMGDLAIEREDMTTAQSLFERSLAASQVSAPEGAGAAATLRSLGRVATIRGEVGRAEELYKQSLALYDRLLIEDLGHAEALHGLGILYWGAGRREEAIIQIGRSLDLLEVQRRARGRSDELAEEFAEKYGRYHGDAVALLIEMNRTTEAFAVLERAHARTLASMLAQRDLVLPFDVPGELERELHEADASYERAQDELGKPGAHKDPKRVEELLGRLREFRARQNEITNQIRKTSPKYASLRYPDPLDLAGARAALDPGTLLLSYSVGKEKSYLFVVSSDPKRGPPLSVFTLPVGEKALRESVQASRRLIEWNKSSPELLSRSRSLYDTLVRPAEGLLGKSDRLLILADGPLHTLPWAALIRDVKGGKPQYLVEWKSIHTAVSATVYAELKKSRRQQVGAPPVELAAFGDPRYPTLPEKRASVKRGDGDETRVEEDEDTIADPQLRSVARGGFRFEPLPASRKEVEEIAGLYAPRSAAYLGADATEERAKTIGKDVPLIHYACHAVVNERFPLDSALVFTIPERPKEGQDNGLLQAWEILERVRIDADLVTLSACDSGLGKEMGGEGLIGLTRAFQYAGARSVLASLWKVEDESTGELMKRFYTYLKSGKTKDEALRLAQIDLIRSPNFSQPKDWAAFELTGDWK